MQRGLGGTAFEPAEQGRDREVTLGPAMLAGLVAGLCILCAVCFLAGYAIGHRGSGATPASSQAAAPQSAPAVGTESASPAANKPSAGQEGAKIAASSATEPVADASTIAPPAAASSETPGSSPVVQAALPVQGPGAQVSAATGQTVQPALARAGAWMVQIAAVSNPEDASVLVAALRKRGYNVSARHDPADNLTHVRVGPFASHNEAASMRQKLMNDGYNAVIEP